VNKLTSIAILCTVVAIVLAPAGVLLAQDAVTPVMEAQFAAQERTSKVGFGYLGIGIGAGLAAIGGGIGIGLLSASVVDASARQPEMQGKLLTVMFIAAALIEGLALFAIVVCILCLFL
jgi:F-type H+-transporting ATPase subunit c